MNINHKKIELFFHDVLLKLKVKKNDRELLIQSLVGSSLRGVDSHGIRLFSHYVHCLEEGRIKNNPHMKLIKRKKGIATYDADDGLGHVAALKASKIVASMAKQNGIAAIGIINSSHYGAAGVYSLEIAQQNCIGLSFTHSDPFAIPFNGKSPFHGTNPYSFTAPYNKNDYLHVDFSSTSIPWNRVMRARSNQTSLKKQVAINKKGAFTQDAFEAIGLAPLGGEDYGYKGFGLSSSIEILCGPLIGMAHGYRLLSMIGPDFKTPRKLGHFLIAMKIDAFVNKKDFFRGIQLYLNDLKKQKPKNKNKKILYPGEIEKITEKFRRSNGIPFDRELRENFLTIAEKYKLKFNL